jgi:hypothetical protein
VLARAVLKGRGPSTPPGSLRSPGYAQDDSADVASFSKSARSVAPAFFFLPTLTREALYLPSGDVGHPPDGASGESVGPQGLKPASFVVLGGTAEEVG